MKKVLLALFLLAIVILVGYLQVVRQSDRLQASYEAGADSSLGLVATVRGEADSLRNALVQKELSFSDSLFESDRAHQEEVDSLEGQIDTLKRQLTQTSKQLKSARAASKSKPASTTAGQTSSPKSPTLNEQIIAYYSQRYRNLPKDLSEYEQKIALNEIREETARKFNISVADLNRIRTDNKLDY